MHISLNVNNPHVSTKRERVTERSRGAISFISRSATMKKLRRQEEMRERKIEGPSTLPDKRERESDKLIKNSNHLRQFCEDRLCFETFQGSFAKNIFKMFTIFIKLSLLYKQR